MPDDKIKKLFDLDEISQHGEKIQGNRPDYQINGDVKRKRVRLNINGTELQDDQIIRDDTQPQKTNVLWLVENCLQQQGGTLTIPKQVRALFNNGKSGVFGQSVNAPLQSELIERKGSYPSVLSSDLMSKINIRSEGGTVKCDVQAEIATAMVFKGGMNEPLSFCNQKGEFVNIDQFDKGKLVAQIKEKAQGLDGDLREKYSVIISQINSFQQQSLDFQFPSLIDTLGKSLFTHVGVQFETDLSPADYWLRMQEEVDAACTALLPEELHFRIQEVLACRASIAYSGDEKPEYSEEKKSFVGSLENLLDEYNKTEIHIAEMRKVQSGGHQNRIIVALEQRKKSIAKFANRLIPQAKQSAFKNLFARILGKKPRNPITEGILNGSLTNKCIHLLKTEDKKSVMRQLLSKTKHRFFLFDKKKRKFNKKVRYLMNNLQHLITDPQFLQNFLDEDTRTLAVEHQDVVLSLQQKKEALGELEGLKGATQSTTQEALKEQVYSQIEDLKQSINSFEQEGEALSRKMKGIRFVNDHIPSVSDLEPFESLKRFSKLGYYLQTVCDRVDIDHFHEEIVELSKNLAAEGSYPRMNMFCSIFSSGLLTAQDPEVQKTLSVLDGQGVQAIENYFQQKLSKKRKDKPNDLAGRIQKYAFDSRSAYEFFDKMQADQESSFDEMVQCIKKEKPVNLSSRELATSVKTAISQCEKQDLSSIRKLQTKLQAEEDARLGISPKDSYVYNPRMSVEESIKQVNKDIDRDVVFLFDKDNRSINLKSTDKDLDPEKNQLEQRMKEVGEQKFSKQSNWSETGRVNWGKLAQRVGLLNQIQQRNDSLDLTNNRRERKYPGLEPSITVTTDGKTEVKIVDAKTIEVTVGTSITKIKDEYGKEVKANEEHSLGYLADTIVFRVDDEGNITEEKTRQEAIPDYVDEVLTEHNFSAFQKVHASKTDKRQGSQKPPFAYKGRSGGRGEPLIEGETAKRVAKKLSESEKEPRESINKKIEEKTEEKRGIGL